MAITLSEVKKDFQSFADDENEVIIDNSDEILLTRLGQEIQCRIKLDSRGNSCVQIDNEEIPYRTFLAKNLARLEIFADKLTSKYLTIPGFVNGPAILESLSLPKKDDLALGILDNLCKEQSPFQTRVVFITADAGQGKTVLLRQYQYQQALRYKVHESHFLFWHVDLQGRQLLRLNEALLGDLGELRITGLYMQSLITLIRHGLLVLAIDGFDELAAEQGSSDAFGALAHLVQLLEDKGTIIAASRRTFFDTEEYLKKTHLLRRTISNQCQFDELELCPWTVKEAKQYLTQITIDGNNFENPEETYNEILQELDNNQHPMLTRPFLLAQLARGLLLYQISASSFIRTMTNPFEGVAAVIEAFINREVTEKWKDRETGEPYLTHDQHMTLLSHVAEEMWLAQKENLNLDLIQEILTMLMDDWEILHIRRKNIIEMVKMHVLLVPPDGLHDCRKFDHPEFRNYMFGYSLKGYIQNIDQSVAKSTLAKLFSIAQLPDSVAKYLASMLEKDVGFRVKIIKILEEIVNSEWKPTYIQTNIGTLIPYLVNGVPFTSPLSFDAKVVYSSLVFEKSKIVNIHLKKGQFVNTTLFDVEWEKVTLENCEFTDLRINKKSTFTNTFVRDCHFNCVIVCGDEGEENREYDPQRIINLLVGFGFEFPDLTPVPFDQFEESYPKKMAQRLFDIFRRTTTVTDHIIRLKYRPDDHRFVFEELIPLLETHELLEQRIWSGRGSGQAWKLKYRIEDILKDQDNRQNVKIAAFWEKLRNMVD